MGEADWIMLGALAVFGLMSLAVMAADYFEGRPELRKLFPNNPALW